MYSLNDLDDPERPMPLIEYTNADTLGDLGPKAELINEYRTYDILGRFGLSLKEYFDMPVDVAVLLIDRARMENKDEKKIQNVAIQQVEQEARKK